MQQIIRESSAKFKEVNFKLKILIMKGIRLIILSIFIVTTLSSCDRELSYKFSAINRSSSNVKVSYHVSTTDTTIFIKPNDSILLFRDTRVGKTATDFVGTEMYIFSKIEAYNVNGLKTKKDIYKRINWDFQATKTEGTYTLTILDTDF